MPFSEVACEIRLSDISTQNEGELALRVPHKFVIDNGIKGFLSTQDERKSHVVKSPESVQYGL